MGPVTTANGSPQPRSAPTADLNPHHVQISRRLYRAAQTAARTAIRKYASDDEQEQLDAAFSIGAAVEYLGRAVVASHDPLLLAKPDSVESQIMLSRANTSGTLDSRNLRTAESHSIWGLLQKLNPKFAPHTASHVKGAPPLVNMVMNLRNGAAHMALVEKDYLEDAARALIAIVESLHPLGAAEEADFWPAELMPTIQLLKDENSTAAALRYEAKISNARAQLERLLTGMSADEQERLQTMLEARNLPELTRERQKNIPQVCPACGRSGVAVYVVEEGEPEYGGYEETRGGSYIDHGWSRALYSFASMFQCPVCGLQLEADEFTAADISTELDEEWEDIEDPYADWEPDEDELRGR